MQCGQHPARCHERESGFYSAERAERVDARRFEAERVLVEYAEGC